MTFQLLHDIGGAAWFGGSLMGLVGVNGAANAVSKQQERPRVATVGWARWAPFQGAALGAHLLGGLGLLVANADRAAKQPGVRSNSIVKTILTLLGVAVTFYSGLLGTRIARAGDVPAEGSVQPSDETPAEIADAQKQLRVLQFAIPALSGAVVALGAQQSQQQRPDVMAAALMKKDLKKQGVTA
jgi:hypothetical protein